MPDTSPNLNLPFLLASQGQKHATLNESINLIDAVLMLCVKSRSLDTPPTSPLEGDRYIIGANPTGAWTGKANQIAAYQNLGWVYILPKKGFVAFCENDNIFRSFNGQNWLQIASSIGDIQNAKLFGIGTNADANNPFSLKANSALFSSRYSSESGSGDIAFTLNKETITNKSAFLFQNNWSGRAEFGLIGNDDFSLKMSADGATFITALTVKPDGKVGIGAGAKSPTKKFVVDSDILINGIGMGRGVANIDTNTAVGFAALGTSGAIGNLNTALGYLALYHCNTGYGNTALGFNSMTALTSGNNNTAVGSSAGSAITTGVQNVSIGPASARVLDTGSYNIAIGFASGYTYTSATDNVSVGTYSLFNNTSSQNVAIGNYSLGGLTSGDSNTAVGTNALTAITTYRNCTGLGANTAVTGSNQVQLGDSATTTYVYGTVQSRSDKRDKTAIRETILGLDFINRLRPIDYKWDYRDDYRDKFADFEILNQPNLPSNFEELPEGKQKNIQKEYEKEKVKFEIELRKRDKYRQDFQEKNKLKNIVKNGSKARSRYHSGLIAQDVKQVLDEMGIDWAAYQDHSLGGGDDVKSLGYTQFIAPIIRAIQELSVRIDGLGSRN